MALVQTQGVSRCSRSSAGEVGLAQARFLWHVKYEPIPALEAQIHSRTPALLNACTRAMLLCLYEKQLMCKQR